MANEHLRYYIEAIWSGKNATTQAKQDIASVGDGGEQSSKKLKSFNSALGTIAAAGALGIIANQALEFGKASVNAASDAEEAYGKFDVVFGQFARATEADLDDIATATGRSKYELIDYASTIQDTFVPLGFAREEAAKMSTSITQLAIDLASFNNLETADVVRDLQSALVGNTETLRKYGVVAQETQIKQEAITLGLWNGVGAIDAQTKAQAILSLTYKGTTDAQGDAERTSESFANKQRALAAASTDLQVVIGQGLVPAMGTLTDIAITATGGLEAFFAVTQKGGDIVDDIVTQNINQAESLDDLVEQYNKVREQQTKWLGLAARVTGTTDDLAKAEEDVRKAVIQSVNSREEYIQALRGMGIVTNEVNEAIQLEYYNELKLAAAIEESTREAETADRAMLNYAASLSETDTQIVSVSTGIQRYAMGLKDAIAPTEQFKQKTGQSADELRLLKEEAEAVTAAFESSFTTALGNTSDAYYTNSVNAGMLNETLFNQVDAMSGNAIVTASAALALGVYDEQQVRTALNAAIIEEKINTLAEAFVNGELTAGEMKTQMDEIVQNSPYTSEIDVLVDKAISNIDKVKSKLDAIDGLVSKASIVVTTDNRTTGGAASGGGAVGRNEGVPQFATGGMVPGPVGSPQLILAHGGEQVLTQAQQKQRGGGGGIVQNFFSNTRESQALAWAQAEQLRRARMDAQ